MTAFSPAPDLRRQALFWLGALALLMAILWLFGGVMLPFVIGMAIAYLLDPLMDRLEAVKIPRGAGAAIILLVFFSVIGLIVFVTAPFVWREVRQLAEAAPGYGQKLWEAVLPYAGWLQEKIGVENMETFRQEAQKHIGKALSLGGGLMAGLADGGRAALGLLATVAIAPISAFFMMKEWDRMVAWVDGLLPRGQRAVIHDLARQIDGKIAGFIRGQITVAVILGLIYAVALTVIGLNFGVLIGLAAGFLYIIPYASGAFGFAASLIVAFVQAGFSPLMAMAAGVFLIGQALETYILTPRLLGQSVGLHPLWILFSVVAGASLFGVTGMLLAVPVAAVAGVLIGFALTRYRASAYYLNHHS